MTLQRPVMTLVLAALAGPAAVTAVVQEPTPIPDELFEHKPPHRRMRMPQHLREQIDALRRDNPDDPRIPKLEERLRRIEQNPHPRGGTRHRGSPGGEFQDEHKSYSDDEIEAFLVDHPQYREILGPQGRPRFRERSHRVLEEIILAHEEGDPARAELLLEAARTHRAIAVKMLAYRRAHERQDAGEELVLRENLRELVEKQVAVDHELNGQLIERLARRVEAQRQRHLARGTELGEVAEQRLERLLHRAERPKRDGGPGSDHPADDNDD